MRILILFDDQYSDFKQRYNSDKETIYLIVRPTSDKDNKLKIIEQYDHQNNSIFDVRQKIQDAKELEVEIIAHSAKGSKTLQSNTKTDNMKYNRVTLGAKTVTTWLEEELITPDNMQKTKISLSACQAAAGTDDFPSIAEQMLRLFFHKPQNISARQGFVYLGKKRKSFGSVKTAAMELGLLNKEKQLNPDIRTKTGQSFIFYYNPKTNTYIKVDKKIYNLYNCFKQNPIYDFLHDKVQDPKLTKNENKLYKKLFAIIHQDLDNIAKKDFKFLVKIALKIAAKNSKLYLNAKDIQLNGAILPMILSGDMSIYTQKEHIDIAIKESLNILRLKSQNNSSKIVQDILKEISNQAAYRQERNYDLTLSQSVITLIHHVVKNKNGEFSTDDINNLKSLQVATISDAYSRTKAAGISQTPSKIRSIYNVTKSKNREFTKKFSELLDQLDTTSKLDIYHKLSHGEGEKKPHKTILNILRELNAIENEIRYQVTFITATMAGLNDDNNQAKEALIALAEQCHEIQKKVYIDQQDPVRILAHISHFQQNIFALNKEPYMQKFAQSNNLLTNILNKFKEFLIELKILDPKTARKQSIIFSQTKQATQQLKKETKHLKNKNSLEAK